MQFTLFILFNNTIKDKTRRLICQIATWPNGLTCCHCCVSFQVRLCVLGSSPTSSVFVFMLRVLCCVFFLLIAGLFVCLFVFIYLFVNYFLFGIILFINHFNVVPLFRWSRLLIDFTDFIIYLLAYIFILFIYVFIYFNL